MIKFCPKWLVASIFLLALATSEATIVQAATISNPGTIYDLTSTFDSFSIKGSLTYTGAFGFISIADLNEQATWNLVVEGDSLTPDLPPLFFSLTHLDSEWKIIGPIFEGPPDPRIQEGRVSINAQPESLTFDLQTNINPGFLASTIGLSLTKDGQSFFNSDAGFLFEQNNSIPPVPDPRLVTRTRVQQRFNDIELSITPTDVLVPNSSLKFPGQPIPEPTSIFGLGVALGFGFLLKKNI